MDVFDPTKLASVLTDFKPLKEEVFAYFQDDPCSVELPVRQLQHTRLRPEGVRNAARLMAAAAAGMVPKRAPLRVRACLDGGWLVLDGNSTLAVARLSAWSVLPCLVEV